MSRREVEHRAAGLACERCGRADSRVTDSRPAAGYIRRRRRCTGCGHRFTTHEGPANYAPLVDELYRSRAAMKVMAHRMAALTRQCSEIIERAEGPP